MADSTSSCSDSSSSSSSSSLRCLSHSVVQLVQWKQPRMSAVAFGLSFLVLVSVATLSIISVVSYLLLACLCVTITFRVYKAVIQAVQKSDDGHPFRSLLERDISVSSESVRLLTDQSLIHLNWFISQSRRLLLVQDLVDSLKLAAVMWLMTYIGSVFNGVTIMILDIMFFTTPLIYQKKKAQIDQNVALLRCRLEETLQKLQNKLPGAVKRTKAE
ncbi:reticulon-3-B isoform X2 [Scophthalmus maximus]|uniref:reticulon-3-B isoform X2 n=1 Tax=Scophthalmus maximus TaxID=52904 RepID=UPI0015E0CCB0|nr:reticulon-3-B isoform X2 [Scophthalmus maximus]